MSSYSRAELIELKNELVIRKARAGYLLHFTKHTFQSYEINWHHKLLCKYLTLFARKEIKRLMVFLPPRHGKSELTSRRLPALWHGMYPNDEIIGASYNADLAGDMTVDVQRIMDKPEYKEIFPEVRIPNEGSKGSYVRSKKEHEVIPYQDPKTKLWSWHGGSYKASGVGGSFTGRGANCILLDDLVKNREDADSVTYRESTWKWYQSTIRSRLEGEGSILLTMTRWHDDDIAGRLLSLAKSDKDADQWVILNLPAVKETNDCDEDPRLVGEPLWENKFDAKTLRSIKASVGPREWSALYQQNPVPDGGVMFEPSMFKFVELPQSFDYRFITADTSYVEKKESDFTVFSQWGVIKEQIFLINVWRKQIGASDIEAAVFPFIKSFVNYGYRGTYIEPKGHGIYLNQKWRNAGLLIPSDNDLKEFYSDRRNDKVERASAAIPYLASRFVAINNQISIKDDLVAECLGFPKRKHDDFVDTLVDAIKFVYKRKVSILDFC